ncbi:unnamed protein product, partial [Darwinula stevensoni]
MIPSHQKPLNGGRFDFDDGGTYCGGWEDGKAHGHGVCTGPKGQGEYSGSWHFGFEVSGVYTWPSGASYEGQWQNGKRHGLGVETRGRWTYKGEWTQGYKGRYGVRHSLTSNAKYEGTWANGLQDGYGSETYADGGTYQGQWMRGMRHGYGVRTSAPYGSASHLRPRGTRASLTSLRGSETAGGGGTGGTSGGGTGGSLAPGSSSTNVPSPESDNERRDRRIDDARGGFVLKARSDEPRERRRGSLVETSSNFKKNILRRLRKQRSTGDLDKRGTGSSLRSTSSTKSSASSTESATSALTHDLGGHTDSNASFVTQDEHVEPQVTETYMGEWKDDKRCGFGVSERSDGLKYEGEWYNNKKYGYGVTAFKDGTKEEGKYKNNVLITSQKKKHLFLIRSAKFRERIEQAVSAAARASKIALQKADIAISRTATARGKAEQADIAALHAREDSEVAVVCAKQFSPESRPPGSTSTAGSKPTLMPPAIRTVPTDIGRLGTAEGKENQIPFHPGPSSTAATTISGGDENPSSNARINVDTGGGGGPRRGLEPPQIHVASVFGTSPAFQSDFEVPQSSSNRSGPLGEISHGHTNFIQQQRGTPGLPPVGETRVSLQQTMTDHLRQYQRPPSRDSSVDRYNRGSRKTPPHTDHVGHAGDDLDSTHSRTNVRPTPVTLHGDIPGESVGSFGSDWEAPPTPPTGTPKRTESLYITPVAKKPPPPNPSGGGTKRRKKSLPEAPQLPKVAGAPMSREEITKMSHIRRQEVISQREQEERFRKNPFLYLVSPNVQVAVRLTIAVAKGAGNIVALTMLPVMADHKRGPCGPHAACTLNEKIDVTDFEFSIKSKGGRCPVRKDFLLTDDGILISRYRLLESCDDIILSVTHRGKHLEGSPYEISGPVYSEECDCPVEDMQAWLEAMGCQDSYPQMDKDLDPFPKVNLTWALEKIIEKFKHPGAQSFCHYVLKDNKVYRKCYGEHVGFHIFSDDILMSLKRKVHLPDMEFVMNLGDWPLVGHSWSSLVPIFSWCGSKDSSDIVLPTYDLTEASLHMLERVTLDMLSVQAKNHVPWHEKIPKAFWRGRDSRKERLDLVRLSQQHWDLLEANLTRMFFFRELEEEFSPFASHVSFFDFFNYKYQVSLDGTVAAYRLPYLLAGNSLLLKQDSDYYEFFYQELQPWIHYVPFKSDLSDLLEKILWAKDHEDEVQRIISRARAFAREHLLPHHILCYHAVMLKVCDLSE